MGAIILGKIHLRWCDSCNLPVLEQAFCGICGSETRQVELTPPGDARPAFESDIRRARKLIDDQFGEGAGNAVIPDGRIVLLNKAPDIDRMDEIILDGAVVGAIRFTLLNGNRFLPRAISAKRIAPHAERNWVRVDDVAAEAIRSKKASTLAVGVIDCDPDIEPGNEVLVLDERGRAVSVGIAKMSSSEMMEHKRGTAVKTRWNVDTAQSEAHYEIAGWDMVIAANKDVMSRRVEEARRFIVKTVEESRLPVAVSYSGGKDSLATLLLVLEAGIKPKLIFVDTGLEFEETRKNVIRTAQTYGLDLVVESAGESFWRNLDHFGPPAKDYRWCCKTCKLGPATQLILKNFPDGVLSFIGQRAYESQQRSEKRRVWRNPWTPNQLAASPIQKWSALHVWIYLFSKEAEVNPLYAEGLERIGCFMCPASDLAELVRVREFNPQYERWHEYLEGFARTKGRSSSWLEYGLWRWKRIPKSVLNELGQVDDDVATQASPAEEDSRLVFRSTSGYNPCLEGLSVEGVFSQSLPMDRVANMLNIIGPVTTSPDMDIAEVRSITVFSEGPVMIKAKDEDELREKTAVLREVVFRAVNCAGCGICVARCQAGALHVDGRIFVDPEKCNHCRKCIGPCPAIRFREEELDI